MKRLISLTLALLLFTFVTGCTGQAAALPENVLSLEETSIPVSAEADLPDAPPEEDPPAKEEAPYVRVIDPSLPMVALTFDDGPHKTYTDAILDILEENHALATFFEVGNNVRNYPEPVLRAYEMGCEVASHSNAHKNLGKMKLAAILSDLDSADEAFIAAGVPAPTLVRPPYGSVNTAVKSQTGRSMITWSIDTEDWKSRNAQTVIEYVQNAGNLDGHVVLMHSIYESTVQAVETLIPWLQEQGYQLVTVTELMAYYYGELPQPDHFYGYTYFFQHGRTDTPVDLPRPQAEETAEVSAVPTSSTVLLNGTEQAFDAYNIQDANYFKLRDLACVLSGTEKQFEVSWDGDADCISLFSGQPYTAVGGELSSQGGGNQAALPTSSKILLDGQEISLTAYNINGANYFKLRDLGEAFNFGVDWDQASQTISISTGKGYTAG